MNAILVPLDGSELALRALPYATAVASRTGQPLLLLRVISTLDCATTTEAAERRRDATTDLAIVAGPLRVNGLTVEIAVIDDEPASAILDLLVERQAGLLVMSTHGRGGLGRWLYGSVADSVLRRSPVPVLLIPPVGLTEWPTDRQLTILVPLDGSALAEAVLGPACALADTLKAGLLLVRSVPFSQYAAYAEGYVFADTETTDHEMVEAERYLEQVAARVRTEQRPVEIRVTYGSPFLDVATVAHEAGAQLIAMATHGRSGVKRAILGSVTTSTVRRADVPLLLVHPAPPDVASQATPPAASAPAGSDAPDITVTLAVSPEELQILTRAVGERIYHLPTDSGQSEPARRLLEKLRATRPATSAPPAASGTPPVTLAPRS